MLSRRVDGAAALRAEPGTTLVAIGNFDGVHAGHRHVLRAALSKAAEARLAPVVLTFHPHPAEVLGRGRQPVLTPLDRKVKLLCDLDPALRVVVQPFTGELASMSPRRFAAELLAGRLGARAVVVGRNFRFGARRAGDFDTLVELGRELGFEAWAADLEGDEAGPFSSSRIREAIARGELKAAERLLGRPHAVSGVVVEGDRRGRTIGVPTANLDAVAELLPPHGVYAGRVDRVRAGEHLEPLGEGVANIGLRPTVGGGLRVEVHLLDFQGNLYGARLRLHLLEFIREERRFDGLAALKAQIERDIAAARGLLRASGG